VTKEDMHMEGKYERERPEKTKYILKIPAVYSLGVGVSEVRIAEQSLVKNNVRYKFWFFNLIACTFAV